MATIPPVEVPVVFAPCPDLKKLQAATELLSQLYLQKRSPKKADFQVIHDACIEVEKLEAALAVGVGSRLISALWSIATGVIVGEEENYEATVAVMREIAKRALDGTPPVLNVPVMSVPSSDKTQPSA